MPEASIEVSGFASGLPQPGCVVVSFCSAIIIKSGTMAQDLEELISTYVSPTHA
jgi:hypothetical protein